MGNVGGAKTIVFGTTLLILFAALFLVVVGIASGMAGVIGGIITLIGLAIFTAVVSAIAAILTRQKEGLLTHFMVFYTAVVGLVLIQVIWETWIKALVGLA